MFLDLHSEVTRIARSQKSIKGRTERLAQKHPGVFIVGAGGFPIIENGGGYCLFDTPVNAARLKGMFKSGLGLSAVMTYMNKSRHSCTELADICINSNHRWADRWMTISLLICGFGQGAELAFARDSSFYLSWPVNVSPGIAFVANGSVRDWCHFVAKESDESFDLQARNAMTASKHVLQQVLP